MKAISPSPMYSIWLSPGEKLRNERAIRDFEGLLERGSQDTCLSHKEHEGHGLVLDFFDHHETEAEALAHVQNILGQRKEQGITCVNYAGKGTLESAIYLQEKLAKGGIPSQDTLLFSSEIKTVPIKRILYLAGSEDANNVRYLLKVNKIAARNHLDLHVVFTSSYAQQGSLWIEETERVLDYYLHDVRYTYSRIKAHRKKVVQGLESILNPSSDLVTFPFLSFNTEKFLLTVIERHQSAAYLLLAD